MKTYKNVACIAPFSSLFINPNGQAFPCCIYNYSKSKSIDETKDQNWNFDHINKEIRQDFIAKGTDIKTYDNCFGCSSNLNSGQYLQHNRESNNNIDYIQTPTLTNLHLKFSNQCNLACRICESGCSNLLYTEDLLLVKNKIRPHILPILNSSLNEDSVLFKSFKDNLHNLNTLYLSGGEPLLHDAVWKLLKLAKEQGYSKNISVKFNTNGTIKLNQEKYDILKSFKHVNVSVSMDGINEHAEYIRTNVAWDRWIENLLEYKKEFINHSNLVLDIAITVSVYNVHIIDKIKDFFNSHGINSVLNFLHEPDELCIRNLNQDVKDYIINKYTNLIKSDHGFYYNELIKFISIENLISGKGIVEFIDKKDNIVIANNLYKNYRAFRDVDPEWHNMLKVQNEKL
jgi:MoaA/NifB/PqqE/SkfB family radical SAM enzyme